MLKINNTLFLVFIVTFQVFSQIEINKTPFNGNIRFVNLPGKLHETSGIIYYNNLIWTFNDSGGRPVLYAVSPENGKIQKKVKIKDAKNFDWEDITQDNNYIYIGDFGNNFGNRKNLRIYKILKSDISDENKNAVLSEKISFTFSNQKDFKINFTGNEFDCESIITYQDSLILFTKDWIKNNSSVYVLSKAAENTVANKITELPVKGLITGAEIIESKNIILLVGHNSISPFIMVLNYSNNNFITFTKAKLIELAFLKGMQIEAIAWDNDKIYLSAENSLFQQRLYIISEIQIDE